MPLVPEVAGVVTSGVAVCVDASSFITIVSRIAREYKNTVEDSRHIIPSIGPIWEMRYIRLFN
jgi:hypothetical protein